MRATLQSALGKPQVNRETRVVEGVRLMENNRDVTYRGADGKLLGFRTNDGLINGLISHAGNRTIPAHLSHDWCDGKVDALHSRVGGVRNFRRGEDGALLADYYAIPGVEGDRILWLAENDPEHAMLSLVFEYNKIESNGVTYAVPLTFDSADFVAKGAAVSAMLSQLTDTDMTKEEIQTLVTESVKAALKDFKPTGFLTPEEADTKVKAALAAYKPEPTVIDDKTIATIADAAEAKVVAKLGGGPLLLNIKKETDANNAFTAKLAEYMKTAPNMAVAKSRLLRDFPDLATAAEAHLQAEVAKLNAA